MPPALEDPLRIGPVQARNRLYRAPVLEVAGNGPDAPDILQRELVPSAESGAGLIFQGACLVTAEGGRTAPGLTRVNDDEFVRTLAPMVSAIQETGAKLFCQIGHGALQCMELWHAAYREDHQDLTTWAVSEPPLWFKALWKSPVLFEPNLHVMGEDDLEALAEAFGRAAGRLHRAGYDGIHLAGANASIFQQLWSPVFNKRKDSFGGRSLADRARFMERVVEEIRAHTTPDYPITTKVPAETEAPGFVFNALSIEDGVQICRLCEQMGIDAVVPVRVGVTRDQSVARGHFPRIGWEDERWQDGYDEAFGSWWRRRLIENLNRAAAKQIPFEPGWNAAFARSAKQAVDIPVLLEGGIRSREQIDTLLDEGACDALGMARPFYAEPQLPARLLGEPKAEALCQNCNNCTVPQVTGAPGVCRTPDVLAKRGEYQRQGRYR